MQILLEAFEKQKANVPNSQTDIWNPSPPIYTRIVNEIMRITSYYTLNR